MKPAFSYYGGKQRIVNKILPFIPRHTVYVEPFCGSATLFWNKKTPPVCHKDYYRDVLNDTNGLIINFFRVLQDEEKYRHLQRLIDYTPYHEEEHKKAKNICKTGSDNDVLLAWAFFVNIQMSFLHNLNSGFGYGKKSNNLPKVFLNKANLEEHAKRLQEVTIHNRKALEIIEMYNDPQTFLYLDPPYPNTNQGHYSGYTIKDYQNLIDILKTFKGSFILSSYVQGIEPEEWKRFDIDATMSAYNSNKVRQTTFPDTKRTESIWIVDNGGGIEQDYFKNIYKLPEFQEIWPLHKEISWIN